MQPAATFYGLGLGAYRTPCGFHFGHAGSVNGTGSIVLVSPDGADGALVVVNLQHAVQGENPNLQSLADRLL
jgi:hypothetical protein